MNQLFQIETCTTDNIWKLLYIVNKKVSKFHFAINTNQRKLHKARKITNLSNTNINLSKKRSKKTPQINKQTG